MLLRNVNVAILSMCFMGGHVGAFAQSAQTLPSTIPLFPLQEVMLFPHVHRPLHIFEPRYREMLADALEGDRIIGMVMLQAGHEADYFGRPPIYAVGCAGVIADVEELPDGRYNVVLHGISKFRVKSEDQSRAYRLAEIQPLGGFKIVMISSTGCSPCHSVSGLEPSRGAFQSNLGSRRGMKLPW